MLILFIRLRMTSSQCLNHPWIMPHSNTHDDDANTQVKVEDKKINTKNLRRFVIRRRWQVSLD